jgi:CBS domain-containing protein
MSSDEVALQSTEYELASKSKESPQFCHTCNEIERFTKRNERFGQHIESLDQLLENIEVFEMVGQWNRGPPVTIYATQTIQYALGLINKFRVFSLPVMNNQDHMIGIVDVLDIVKELVSQCFHDKKFDEAKAKQFFETTVDKLFLQQVTKARSKSFVISRHAKAKSVIHFMLLHKKERFIIVDRIVAGDCEEQPYPEIFFQGIISATDILKFLCRYPTWLKKDPLFHRKVRDLFEKFREPLVVKQSELASKVFSEMGHNDNKGVAVVDDNGKLLYNISASDLKGIDINNSHILNSTLREFKDRDRSRDWWTAPICVDLDSTLYETLQQFVCTRVHRMYIIDEQGKPTGELNHRDLLRLIYEYEFLTQKQT